MTDKPVLRGYGTGPHRPLTALQAQWCANCGQDWPCPTAEADEPPSEEDCSDSNLRLPHRKASNPRYCQQCEIDVLTAQLAAATLRADRAEEALRKIASCTSFHPGDVVDIARTTLAALDADQEAAE